MGCPSAISRGVAGAARRLQGACSCGGWGGGVGRGPVSSKLRVGRRLAQRTASLEGVTDRAATAKKEEGFVESPTAPSPWQVLLG